MLKKRFLVALLALSLVAMGGILTSLSVAADNKAGPPGSLTVTVLDSKDQPAVGAQVQVRGKLQVQRAPGGAGPGPVAKAVLGVEEPIELQKGGPVVATAVTNDKGVAEFKTIKPGEYDLRCGSPSKMGYNIASVTVEPGKPQAVTVKLNPPVKASKP